MARIRPSQRKRPSTAAQPDASVRIAHIADVHLGFRRYSRLTKEGFNQREIDVAAAFREVVDRCAFLKPDMTIIAGDLFHSVRPSNAVLSFAFREIRRLTQVTAAPVVIVAGNHETPRRADTGSPLKLLAEIPSVFVADAGIQTFAFEETGLAVTCVPHAALLDGIERPPRADDRVKHNVLVIHAQVDRSLISDFGGVDIELARFSPFEWDYIALGHVHIRKEIGVNAAYSGSTEFTSTNIWHEASQTKGFLCIDLPSGKRVFHSLTAPREVLSLEPIDAADLEPEQIDALIETSLASIAGGIEGKIVRLELRQVPKEVFLRLNHRALRVWRSRALHLNLEVRTAMPAATDQSSKVKYGGTIRDQLRGFCLERIGRPFPAQSVADCLDRYMAKVEEEDEAR